MRRELPYFYAICDTPDELLFQKQCAAIEKNIPHLKKLPLLEDVDGSSYQEYHRPDGIINVCNDFCFGGLYVESDFDLLPYFNVK